MDGPWTQFAAPSAAPPPAEVAGPWTQFAPQSAGEFGFSPAPPPPAPPPPSPKPTSATVDDYGRVTNDSLPDVVSGPETGIPAAIAKGAAEGFGSEPLGISDRTAQTLRDTGIFPDPATGRGGPLRSINEAIIRPVAAAGDLIYRTGGAIMRGGQEGLVEAGRMAGQEPLARDIAAIPEAFAGMPGGLGVPRPPEAAPPSASPVHAPEPPALPPPASPPAPVAPDFVPPGAQVPALPRILELIRADDAVAANRPAMIPPDAAQPPNPLNTPAPRVVPTAAADNGLLHSGDLTATPEGNGLLPPQPASVGASASREMSTPEELFITPAQEKAYRSTAEGQKLLEPQPVGVEDRTLYVPGTNPTNAEIEQSVNTARELKSLNVTAPGVSEEAKAIHSANNEARQRFFETIAGSDVDVANAKAAREAQATQNLTSAWANKTDADAKPIVDVANAIKDTADGRRPLVRNVVGSVVKELYDKNGDLIKDPELLYGVRKHVDDLINENDAAGKPKNARAMASLLQIKAAIDGAIEPAANGFGKYLKDFKEASVPIDEMQALQKHENGLYGADNYMTYSKFQSMMKKIVDSRQADGLNPYKSISEASMQKLWALRDDLRRSQSTQRLAGTPGSDSVQNAWDAVKGAAGGTAGTVGSTVIGGMLGGPIGSTVAGFGQKAISNMMAARTSRQQTARGMQILHSDPTTLRNGLMPD
jgi:hypothetical protein